jgi:hypothetical protein
VKDLAVVGRLGFSTRSTHKYLMSGSTLASFVSSMMVRLWRGFNMRLEDSSSISVSYTGLSILMFLLTSCTSLWWSIQTGIGDSAIDQYLAALVDSK